MLNTLVALVIGLVTLLVAGFSVWAIKWCVREARVAHVHHSQTRDNLNQAYEPTKSGYVMVHGHRPDNITTGSFARPTVLKPQQQ